MKNIIEELSWRNLIQDKVPGLKKRLNKPITIYIGFDPSSSSLHIGNIVPIIILIHFKKFGHNSIALVGGATGFIGDPSERHKKREIINENILKKNTISIETQIYKLFSYFSEKIELLNNFDWIKNIYFIDFIKNIGIHFSVNYLISKKSMEKRIKKGIYFNEFSYPLIQGYDFLYLNKEKNCQLQVGGSDQWGNITIGIELIKKKTKKKAYGLTFPLITNSNGIKFGKSNNEKENIWLNEKKTSPYKFYQFWINLSDLEVKKYIKIYTFLSKKEINSLIVKHEKYPNKRLLQKKLACYMTKWIHGDKKYQMIVNITSTLFNKDHKILSLLKEKDYMFIYKNIPHSHISKKKIEKGILLSDLMKEIGFFSSKSRANHAIKTKSIYINKIITKENITINKKNLINKKYILFQFGKKNFFILMTK
ncbi:tyrosine--tRNA ligase [Blattabacterium cuenoti]|uniref:tyrosine--tRNA ligase n=1 Tax=Blattabacterium cuenoti TaxID=1653831 RepID=UPI00163D1F89|nr:tyrosine--tRNA ligase [Blattabacterium cuenoti]